MIEGLRTAGKDDILAVGYTFAGLVYRTEDDQHWLKRRFAMFHDILEVQTLEQARQVLEENNQ